MWRLVSLLLALTTVPKCINGFFLPTSSDPYRSIIDEAEAFDPKRVFLRAGVSAPLDLGAAGDEAEDREGKELLVGTDDDGVGGLLVGASNQFQTVVKPPPGFRIPTRAQIKKR